MRLREVKKGMKVRVYRSIDDSGKQFVGRKGEVVNVLPLEYIARPFRGEVLLEGCIMPIAFSHKELKEVK